MAVRFTDYELKFGAIVAESHPRHILKSAKQLHENFVINFGHNYDELMLSRVLIIVWDSLLFLILEQKHQQLSWTQDDLGFKQPWVIGWYPFF